MGVERQTNIHTYKHTNTHTLFGKLFQETRHAPGLKMHKKEVIGMVTHSTVNESVQSKLLDICTLNARFLFHLNFKHFSSNKILQ